MVNCQLNDIIYEERLDVLTEGLCGSILPASLIRGESTVKIIYNAEGFTPLRSAENTNAFQALKIAEQAIEVLKELEEYLIFPEELVLSCDSLFISDDRKSVKLIYIPFSGRHGGSNVMVNFLRDLKKITTENGNTYMDTMIQLFSVKNISAMRAAAFIRELMQEVYICKIQ